MYYTLLKLLLTLTNQVQITTTTVKILIIISKYIKLISPFNKEAIIKIVIISVILIVIETPFPAWKAYKN